MAMTFRDIKGSPLSSAEVDENFRTLLADIQAINDNIPVGVSIVNFTVNGLTFTVHYSNGDTQGPLPLPVAPGWNYRGNLAGLGVYLPFDVFTVTTGDERSGIYLVLADYTAPATIDDFDPEAQALDTEGGPALQMLMSVGSNTSEVVPFIGESDVNVSADLVACYVRVDNGASLATVHIPPSDDPFPIGGSVVFRNVGTGGLAFVADAGSTEFPAAVLNVPEGALPFARGLHSTVTLIRVFAAEWDIAGDLLLDVVTEP